MCRLYAFRANEPTKVECTLVRAQNALLAQSRRDRRGKSHPDGWGVAVYENEHPDVERRAKAAYEDLHFNATAERLYAKTVLAHVRHATIGGPSLANTHPFAHGPWCMTHNGTVRGFLNLREQFLRETAPRFHQERLGTTDSEQIFLWLLSRMEEAGISADAHCADTQRLVEVFAAAIAEIARRSRATGAAEPAELNLNLTDGDVLLVSRWHHTLYWTYHDGLTPCETCGVPHVQHRDGLEYRAVIVASEPFSQEPWHEFPEESLMMVDERIEPHVQKIA
jgi:glutamine amidotransferase